MKPLTLSVSVFLVLQRTFHRTECNENAIVQATPTNVFCGNDTNVLFFYELMFP